MLVAFALCAAAEDEWRLSAPLRIEAFVSQ
jgi:hypothetical protein